MKSLLNLIKTNIFLFLPFIFIPQLGNTNSLFGIIFIIFYFFLNPKITFVNPFKRKITAIFLVLISFVSIHSFVFTDYTFINFIGSNARNYGILFYSLLFILFLNFLSFKNRRIQRIFTLNLMIANILSVIGILQLFIPDIYAYADRLNFFDAKIFSSFLLPNFFGQYLAISIALEVYKKLTNQTKSKFIFVLPFIALLFTRSKIGILACGLSFAIYFFHKNKKFSFKLISPLVLLLPIISFFSEHFHFSRSIFSRIEIWKSALLMFKDNLWGVNLFGFENLFSRYINFQHYLLEQNLDVIYDKAHNFLLDYFLIFGLFGFIFLVPILIEMIRIIKLDYKKLVFFLPIILIGSFSIFSVPSMILICLSFAYFFKENSEFKSKIILKFSSLLKVYLILIFILFSGTFYGQVKYLDYQNSNNVNSLNESLIYNPSNLSAVIDIIPYIQSQELPQFYKQSLRYFSNKNLVLKRAIFKSRILNQENLEIELKSLINQNPNDFKNHLLLANYYYYKKDNISANITYNQMKKHIDISKIETFIGYQKFSEVFKKFD